MAPSLSLSLYLVPRLWLAQVSFGQPSNWAQLDERWLLSCDTARSPTRLFTRAGQNRVILWRPIISNCRRLMPLHWRSFAGSRQASLAKLYGQRMARLALKLLPPVAWSEPATRLDYYHRRRR